MLAPESSLIALEQLRQNAFAKAAARGRRVASQRIFFRNALHWVWSRLLPVLGLFFCFIVILVLGISITLGGVWIETQLRNVWAISEQHLAPPQTHAAANPPATLQ